MVALVNTMRLAGGTESTRKYSLTVSTHLLDSAGRWGLSNKHNVRYASAGHEMPLSIDDKQEVLEALFLARDKWNFIGGALGLKDDALRCIAQEQSETDDRLDRVIARWLHNGVNCTWEAVAAALRSVTVSRPDLAEEVERKYQIRPSVPPVPPPQPAGAQDKELSESLFPRDE